MPIKLTYKLTNAKLKKAVQRANEILATEDLPRVINTRATPFDESEPSTLPASAVADYLKNSQLSLTVCHYTNPKSSIGGMFTTTTPKRIHANRKAVPIRHYCNLARMLVHEAIHALSYNIREASFSHCSGHSPSTHSGTAPYWIQNALKPLCPGVRDDDLIEVELLDNAASLRGRNIRCG